MLKDNKEYFGESINKWGPEHKNAYVITGMISGKENIAENRVGRVAQVRLEGGDFGSDLVLLRHRNDILTPHANQSFYLIPDKFKAYLDEEFKNAHMDDSDADSYTLQGKESEIGFIIASPFGPDDSTPMRDIKEAIFGKIEEIIKDGSV